MSTAWPRPRSRLFLGPLPEALRRLPVRLPGAHSSGIRSAPPLPRRSPSFAAASARARPPRRRPGSRRPIPVAWCPAPRAPRPRRLPSPGPAPHPAQLGLCLCPPPHPHPLPLSLFCLLACLLALRPGEAASQENPRNLCKKLTMKFKKFFDFGAIFEWSER